MTKKKKRQKRKGRNKHKKSSRRKKEIKTKKLKRSRSLRIPSARFFSSILKGGGGKGKNTSIPPHRRSPRTPSVAFNNGEGIASTKSAT